MSYELLVKIAQVSQDRFESITRWYYSHMNGSGFWIVTVTSFFYLIENKSWILFNEMILWLDDKLLCWFFSLFFSICLRMQKTIILQYDFFLLLHLNRKLTQIIFVCSHFKWSRMAGVERFAHVVRFLKLVFLSFNFIFGWMFVVSTLERYIQAIKKRSWKKTSFTLIQIRSSSFECQKKFIHNSLRNIITHKDTQTHIRTHTTYFAIKSSKQFLYSHSLAYAKNFNANALCRS